jgi:hypothetical protein
LRGAVVPRCWWLGDVVGPQTPGIYIVSNVLHVAETGGPGAHHHQGVENT